MKYNLLVWEDVCVPNFDNPSRTSAVNSTPDGADTPRPLGTRPRYFSAASFSIRSFSFPAFLADDACFSNFSWAVLSEKILCPSSSRRSTGTYDIPCSAFFLMSSSWKCLARSTTSLRSLFCGFPRVHG